MLSYVNRFKVLALSFGD